MKHQALLQLALSTALITSTHAFDRTWDGTGGNDAFWNSKQNWGGNTLASGDNLFFGGASRLTNTNDLTNYSFAGITFNSGAGLFVLQGNAITLTGGVTNNSTNVQTVELAMALSNTAHAINAASGNLALKGALSGTGSVNKTGNGTLTLSANNSYSGGTVLDAGTLVAGNANAFGSGTITVNGGVLDLNAYAISAPVLVNSGAVNSSVSTSSITFNNGASINGAFAGTVDMGNSGSRVLNNSVSGASFQGELRGQGLFAGGLVNVSGAQNPGAVSDGAGTQRFNNGLTYASASTVEIDFNGDTLLTAGADYDQVQVDGGALSIVAGATLRLDANGVNYANTAWSVARSFAVVQRSGSATFNGSSTFNLDLTQAGAYLAYGTWSLAPTADGIQAQWTPLTAVPEPSLAMLGGLGVMALLRRRR